jgi:hypothetical protein
MRLSSAATVCMLLGLALVLPACGGERTATAGGTTRVVKGAEAGKVPAAGSCRRQLRGFVGSLDALREQLATGLDYRGYLSQVRGVRVVYEGIRADRLAIGCLIASGTSAERGFNLYIDAANAWGECLATASCETAAIEPELQRRWSRAAELVSEAQRGLRESSRY